MVQLDLPDSRARIAGYRVGVLEDEGEAERSILPLTKPTSTSTSLKTESVYA